MNVLTKNVFGHYKFANIDYLGICPSCEDGFPNVSFCAFKESGSCTADFKYAFVSNVFRV